MFKQKTNFIFLNYIFRFYDMNKDRQQIMRLVDTRNIFDEIAVVPSLLEIKEKDP